MNKKICLFGVTLLATMFLINLASAGYSYSYPTSYYSSSYVLTPTVESQFEKAPSFINQPTVNYKTVNNNAASSFYNRNYQGPVIERTTRYDELTRIKRGKLFRLVSETTTERYVGAAESESRGSQSQSENTKDYSSIPTNPTVYDGGSLWRYKSSFEPQITNQNSYTKPYYYAPRYDSRGYYNWRY